MKFLRQISFSLVLLGAILSQSGCFSFKSDSVANLSLPTPICRQDLTVPEQQTLRNRSDKICRKGWQLLLENRHWEEAYKKFTQAWMLDPNYYKTYWGMGVSLCSAAADDHKPRKMMLKSVDNLQKANRLSPENYLVMMDFAHACNGMAHFSKDKLERLQYSQKSEKICLDILKKYKKSYRTKYLLSVSLYYQGRYQESYNKIREAQNGGFVVHRKFLDMVRKKLR